MAVDCRLDGLAGPCTAMVRPERVRIGSVGGAGCAATVESVVFAGALTHVVVSVDDHRVEALVANDGARPGVAVGDRVTVAFDPEGVRLLAD